MMRDSPYLKALMLRLLWPIVVVTMLWALPAHAKQDFLPPEQAFRLNIIKQADGQVRLNWKNQQRILPVSQADEGQKGALPAVRNK